MLKSLSCVQLFATPWTVAHQAPPSMEFSRQEYWSGLPCPPPGNHPQPRDQTQVCRTAAGFFTVWAIREASCHLINLVCAKSFAWIILFNLQYIYCPLPTPPPYLCPAFSRNQFRSHALPSIPRVSFSLHLVKPWCSSAGCLLQEYSIQLYMSRGIPPGLSWNSWPSTWDGGDP